MIGRVYGSAPDARRRRGCGMARNEHAVLSRSCGRLHWQDIAVMHSRVANCGNISPRCIPSRQVVASFRRGAFFGRSPMAKRSRNAFPSVRQWQDIAAVRFRAVGHGSISPRCVFGGVQSWRDYAVVRSRAAIRGGFFTSCVLEGASDGKSASSRQHIAAMHPKRAGFGKICAPCIRKRRKQPSENTPREDLAMKGPFSLRGPLESCTARGSCRRSALAGRWALCVEGWGRVA